MNPYLAAMRTRCMPRSYGDQPTGWDYNSPTIAPAPQWATMAQLI